MRHVDDGTIHAWLDGQVGDPAEAAWIEQHVRACAACAARLAEERSTFDQASAILSTAAPPVTIPPFSEIAARAGSDVPREQPRAGSSSTRRLWMVPVGWAASLVLAAGIGWLARDLTNRREAVVIQDATEARATDLTLPAPVEQPAAPETPSAPAPAPAATPRQRVVERSAPAPVPPAELGPETARAAPPSEAPAVGIEATARQAAAAPAAPPPPPAAPPLPPAPLPVVGLSETSAAADASANAIEWRTLPRTEAAAATGMPLYGIDGLEPVQTMLSADGRVVRTRYRLASGELVELEQRRGDSGAPPPPALQETIQLLAPRGRGGVATRVATPPPRVLSVARGDVQLTLRTASQAPDLAALSARLRVD